MSWYLKLLHSHNTRWGLLGYPLHIFINIYIIVCNSSMLVCCICLLASVNCKPAVRSPCPWLNLIGVEFLVYCICLIGDM